MPKIKTLNSNILLQKQLKNKTFAKEYQNLEKEFAIAREVIGLRKHAELTQKELAKKAGTSQPAIARLESGEYQNLTLSYLRRVGKALGVVPVVHFVRQ